MISSKSFFFISKEEKTTYGWESQERDEFRDKLQRISNFLPVDAESILSRRNTRGLEVGKCR